MNSRNRYQKALTRTGSRSVGIAGESYCLCNTSESIDNVHFEVSDDHRNQHWIELESRLRHDWYFHKSQQIKSGEYHR